MKKTTRQALWISGLIAGAVGTGVAVYFLSKPKTPATVGTGALQPQYAARQAQVFATITPTGARSQATQATQAAPHLYNPWWAPPSVPQVPWVGRGGGAASGSLNPAAPPGPIRSRP
jgi:hypothetical protein